MTYVGRVRVSYAPRMTKLERRRLADAEYDKLAETLGVAERLWDGSDKSRVERLYACTAVLATVTHFAVKIGMPPHAKERLNDLLVALGELHSGRHAVLFSPASVHAGKFSATDLQQQAIAQVCVDLLRDAGATAAEARSRVSAQFENHQLPRFSEAKLRNLNSRLRGPGSSQDEAYDLYQWAKEHRDRIAAEIRIDPRQSVSKAAELVKVLVELTKRRDHRRDFFFAPGEDSSAAL